MTANWLRRRSLWSNTSTQLRILLLTLINALVVAFFMSWFIFAMLWRQLAEHPHLLDPHSPRSPIEVFGDIWVDILPYGLLLFGLLVLCTLGVGLILSHQIAGPIYQLKKTLKCFQEGRMDSRVSLRQRDSLKDLATTVNETLETIQARDRRLKEQVRLAEEALSCLPEPLGQEFRLDPEDLEKVRLARDALVAGIGKVESHERSAQ